MNVDRSDGNWALCAIFAGMASPSGSSGNPGAIPFAPPYIDEATIAAVERVLRSGWITTGPETAAFETELARFLGVDHVLCGGSWTGLAGVVLDWFGVGPGDEVVLPAYTYCATANIVLHRGATPVLVDLPAGPDRDGHNITWEMVEPLLSPRTRVVMPVDIGGWPVRCDHWRQALEDWSRRTGYVGRPGPQEMLGRPLLLSDAAHSLGAEIEGNQVGRQADITVFSFHAVKNLTTAEGGAAAIHLPAPFLTEEVHRTLKSHALHGQSKDAAAKFHAQGKGQWHYDVTHPGFKCNMTDIQAAMGRVALERYSEDLSQRRALADAYGEALSRIPGLTLPRRRDGERRSADHLYIIGLPAGLVPHRDAIMTSMADRGVATNVHFPPVPTLTAYRERGWDAGRFPASIGVHAGAISLPIHLHMDRADVARVVACLEEAISSFSPAQPT